MSNTSNKSSSLVVPSRTTTTISVEPAERTTERTSMADEPKSEAPQDEGAFFTTIRPLLAEFVGQIFFVYMICLTSFAGPLAGLGVGLTLFVVICWFAHISGGHYNPAVTVGVMLAGEIKPVMAAGYVTAQLTGATVSGLLYRASVPKDKYDASVGGSGALTIPNAIINDVGQAYLIETMMTTILVFTVLMVAVDSKGSKSFLTPFVIGTVVSLDALIGGAYTGASMNPARSFGPALTYDGPKNQWENHWVFWAGPLTGSIIAALMYKLIFAEKDKLILGQLKQKKSN